MLINPNGWYSVQDIADKKLIPFLNTAYKIKKWIDRGYLKGNKVGLMQGKRYFIRGSEIIKFIAKWEGGDFR